MILLGYSSVFFFKAFLLKTRKCSSVKLKHLDAEQHKFIVGLISVFNMCTACDPAHVLKSHIVPIPRTEIKHSFLE